MQEIFICSNISISQQPRSLIHSLMCLKVDLLKPNSDKKKTSYLKKGTFYILRIGFGPRNILRLEQFQTRNGLL